VIYLYAYSASNLFYTPIVLSKIADISAHLKTRQQTSKVDILMDINLVVLHVTDADTVNTEKKINFNFSHTSLLLITNNSTTMRKK
jgi:hypothetical protein